MFFLNASPLRPNSIGLVLGQVIMLECVRFFSVQRGIGPSAAITLGRLSGWTKAQPYEQGCLPPFVMSGSDTEPDLRDRFYSTWGKSFRERLHGRKRRLSTTIRDVRFRNGT